MSLYLPDDPTEVPQEQRIRRSVTRAIYAREVRLDRERLGVDATGYAAIEAGKGPNDGLEDIDF